MKTPTRLAALAAVAVIAISACSSAASTQSPSAAAPTGSAAASAQASSGAAQLTGHLTVWESYGSAGGSAEFRAFQRIVQQIQTANPGLTLETTDVPFSDIFKKFETESAAGGGPDMFIAPNDSLGAESRIPVLEDVTGKIDDVVAASTDVSVAGSKVDGKLFEVPESLKAVAMYYDAKKVPTPPKTTDDLMAFVKGGGKVGIISGEYFDWGFYGAFGGKIFDDAGKCAATATTGVADAMKYIRDLKAAGALVDADYGKVNDAFKNGKVDIILNGNWTLGDYRAARPDVAVAPIPAGPNNTPATPLVGVDGFYINASSQNKDLAIAVAKQFVSAANEQVYVDVAGHVPANKSIQIIDPLVKSFSDAINAGMARPQGKVMDNYWSNFGNAWKQVLTANGDPTASVATACQAMDKANGS
ncbi:MAG TPA: extracellular solute-binding protein [Candidatus Limnocylindrales bacterium]